MNYEKNIWTSGDVITAEKLNHIEDALAEMLNGSDVDAEDKLNVDPTKPDHDHGGR